MRRLYIVGCLIVGCLFLPGWIAAQLPPLGVPGGVVRLELDGSLETYDRRFLNGGREGYAADLSSPALGSDRIPALADADARIGRITGNPSYRINLGVLSTDAEADVGTGFLGLSLGLTNHITIFGRMPLVRTRVQSSTQSNPASADAGLNPGVNEQLPFFDQMDASLAVLSDKLTAGDYDANPAQKALAQSTLAQGTSLRDDLFALMADPEAASPALPTTASVAGSAVTSSVAALQSTLAADLGVTGFTLAPALPTTPITEPELTQLLTDPNGSVAVRASQDPVVFRGDAEVGASLTLVDRWDLGTHRGGFRAALSGLARLPTGNRDRTDQPLDIGTGEGQADIQIDLVTDVGSGPVGARLSGSYVRQLPSNILSRVATPAEAFAGPARLSIVRRDPGDIISIGVHPFYRLARTLAFTAGVDHWTRGTDEVSYADPAAAIPGVDASVLAQDSKANSTLLSLGITYSNPGGLRPGGTGLPVDASWSYERVLRSGGGRVPDTHRIAGSLRVYFGIW